jgi:hypothetical protein
MSISYTQATSALATGEFTSVASLLDLAKSVSGQVVNATSDTVYFLYSGSLPDGTPAFQAAEAMETGATRVTIRASEAGKLMNDNLFQLKLTQAIMREIGPDVTPDDPRVGEKRKFYLDGKDASGRRVNFNSLWDIASKNYGSSGISVGDFGPF